ncbi:MXAN_5187 C-terminal domain-containing protein [Pendulispora albinea]|uniref:CHASE4 domain-containing protein n=1 Tax=Pendulispora albinea TaxID=2741071 RepID=A0ABZ2LVR9_9BACT
MMLLSRFWYVFLSLLVAISLYVTYVAVGQYNRRNQVAMTEGLASDSQVVRWAMQIDARRRLDALLPAAVDKEVQESLVAATTKDKILPKWRDDSRRGLDAFNQKLPPDLRYDALFAVDRDGRVLAQVGFDQANAFDDFELGGYPAVYDALHGYLRDDTWVLGGRLYRVSARSVEYDVTQPPAGAVVALRLVDARYAQDISNLTRTNVAFYAAGVRVASAAPTGAEGFDSKLLDQLSSELPQVEADKTYRETGRSGIRLLDHDDLGAIFARFEGDAWEQRAGFVVARTRVSIAGPTGFLSGADDKDRANAPRLVLALVALAFALVGFGFSFVEHTLPLNEMKRQAERLRQGGLDLLQLSRFRGLYRPIATDINAGIERVAEKGGAPRKLADVEKIIGPLPAQPAMSAFAFPGPDGQSPSSQPPPPPPFVPPGNRQGGMPSSRPVLAANASQSGGFAQAEVPSRPGFAGRPGGPPAVQAMHGGPPSGAMPGQQAGAYAASARAIPAPQPSAHNLASPQSGKISAAQSGPHSVPQSGPHGVNAPMAGGPPRPPPPARISRPNAGAPGAPPPVPPPRPVAPGRPPPPPLQRPATAPTSVAPLSPEARALLQEAKEDGRDPERADDEPATVVGSAPRELLAKAAGEEAEWRIVYEDFIRTKQQCGESTEGLTFAKFQHTLRKNRDALIQRHGCKRVRFSVYVKEGRASLKATPVKD